MFLYALLSMHWGLNCESYIHLKKKTVNKKKIKMQRCKGTTGRGVIGRFSTSDAAVDVMERPADSPKMCRMSTDCCSDDI